jgi:hypothetical protein
LIEHEDQGEPPANGARPVIEVANGGRNVLLRARTRHEMTAREWPSG